VGKLSTATRADGGVSSVSDLSEIRFLTVAEVAALMRVSRMTVYRLVHSGELASVRVGKSFRVPERAVHDYLRGAFTEAGYAPPFRLRPADTSEQRSHVGSVIKKRRKRMAKKKHRKLLKKTRVQRRNKK